jgi:crotonobetainyl-CoA:carnitine CoA-transferase CaiB-like acyl-CoA transferase
MGHPSITRSPARSTWGAHDRERDATAAATAPLLGEHNIEVYVDRLGYSKQELAAMRAQAVI